ncbi:MAG: hypothetical protein JXR37_14670 [Kiritimatiellae bacterium]|nr:hypothetical protein [Kiritimatiellia bacterium]
MSTDLDHLSQSGTLAACLTLACAVLVLSVNTQAKAAEYYASPAGGGDGRSAESPFKIADFWAVAKPGDTLLLLDGVYRGADSMIAPPEKKDSPGNLGGEPGKPITVRALNDGKVEIDGAHKHIPVCLRHDWFVLEGFNAHSSRGGVVSLSRANHNVIRRICAWDSADGNTSTFGVHHGEHNLIEDCAGWGIARKIYSGSYFGDYLTLRRCWGRWEGCHHIGPKKTYTLAYENYHMLIENCLGTWSGERVKEEYALIVSNKPEHPKANQKMRNHAVDQAQAIFGFDGIGKYPHKSQYANSRLLGCMAYLHGTDRFQGHSCFVINKLNSIDFANNVAYIEPGAHPEKYTFRLGGAGRINSGRTAGGENLKACSLTGIGGTGSEIKNDVWGGEHVLEGASVAELFGNGDNAYTSKRGADIYHRYKDGVLTDEPLWPWPMDQRIKEAMARSGSRSVTHGMQNVPEGMDGTVTGAIQSMFGPIPNVNGGN